MDEKNTACLIALVAIVVAVMLGGCIDGIIQPTPTPAPTATPTPEPNEERELIRQWLQMYDVEFDEDGLDEFMGEFKKLNIHPVEIYRGSLIFYEKSYGYMYIPEVEDSFRTMPYVWIEDWTDDDFVDLVRENGGTATVIRIFGVDRTLCGCFQTSSGAENFLAEFWSIQVPTSTPPPTTPTKQ